MIYIFGFYKCDKKACLLESVLYKMPIEKLINTIFYLVRVKLPTLVQIAASFWYSFMSYCTIINVLRLILIFLKTY